MTPASEPDRGDTTWWRARWVMPLTASPLENAAVGTRDGRICHVLPWTDVLPASGDRVVDFGDAAILPGFVNAHCHLDYTHMAGQLRPLARFTDWIKAIVALKACWSYSEYASSWVEGARMLLQTGTTTVADTECAPELMPDVLDTTPLRIWSFLELIHLKDLGPSNDVAESIARKWATLSARCAGVGLSPHAPYSTSSALLQSCASAARQRQWRLSTHVAESEEEFQMYRFEQGALHTWLRKQRGMQDCGHGSPVAALARLGYLGPDLLAIHANYLDRTDAALLSRHQCHVVHCPRSHAFFKHLRFPLEELTDAGVNVCLGTDSLASVNWDRGETIRLSMIREMRQLAQHRPSLDPAAIVRMATVHGARALGQAGRLGELIPGAKADMIVVPGRDSSRATLEHLIWETETVLASIIGGRQVYAA